MRSWLGLAATLLLLSAPAAAWQKPPRGAQGQIAFGVDMAQRGLWSEALFRFRQAERMGDERPAVLNNIAVAYEALGQFDQAQTYYKRALEQDPRNAGLKRNYSRFVEFYQSFKPDQPAEPGAGESAPAGGDGASPTALAPTGTSADPPSGDPPSGDPPSGDPPSGDPP